jgi:hypothetical protein
VLAGGFQHVQRAARVHIEIVIGAFRAEIMAWLCRRMDDHIRRGFADQRRHAAPIPNIQFVVGKVAACRFQPPLIPTGVPLFAKEVGAHVIVYAVNTPSKSVEICNDFGTNEPVRTSDDQLFQSKCAYNFMNNSANYSGILERL